MSPPLSLWPGHFLPQTLTRQCEHLHQVSGHSTTTVRRASDLAFDLVLVHGVWEWVVTIDSSNHIRDYKPPDSLLFVYELLQFQRQAKANKGLTGDENDQRN